MIMDLELLMSLVESSVGMQLKTMILVFWQRGVEPCEFLPQRCLTVDWDSLVQTNCRQPHCYKVMIGLTVSYI